MDRKRTPDGELGLCPKRKCEALLAANHTCTTPQLNENKPNQTTPNEKAPRQLTLDQLPPEILESIFEHLPQPDLLRVCLTTGAFYWPAYKWLYRDISVTYKNTVEECEIPNHTSHYPTLLLAHNREKLLATVSKNKHIAVLVKSLTVTELWRFMEPFPIMPFLEGMLAYTQLDTFNSVESLDIPPEAMIHVQRMSCTMYTQPIFPPNLIELKMNCEIAFLESCDFAGLALEMITQNAHQKLKKLSLTSDYESNHIDEMYYEEMLFEGRPNWLKFFYVFAQKGIKLNLTALGIEGEFCNAPNDMSADIVSQAVELSDLDTLEIKYENYIHTHPARYREDGVHTCLNDLTKKLPSLRKLSIQHTRVCSEHEIDALNRILRENIPNQLNDLRIYFEDQTSGESESVRRTILNCQKNLAKLTFSHDPPADLLSRHFMGVLGLEDLEQECLDDQYRRNVLSPKILNFSGGKPFVSDEILRSIINCRRKFLSFLRSDSLYKGAAQNLPFLIEYSVLGLRINMRERSIDFRGVCISLEKLALHGDEGDLEMIKG